MLDFLKSLFGFKAKPAEAAPSAPYKVPEPAATTPIPLVVEEKAKAPAKPKAAARTAKPKAPKAKAPAKPKTPKAKPTAQA